VCDCVSRSLIEVVKNPLVQIPKNKSITKMFNIYELILYNICIKKTQHKNKLFTLKYIDIKLIKKL